MPQNVSKKLSMPPGGRNDSVRVRYGNLSALSQSEFDFNRDQVKRLAWLSFLDIAVFFGVLLVGFAYLWKRGDLHWVRSLSEQQPDLSATTASSPLPRMRPADRATSS